MYRRVCGYRLRISVTLWNTLCLLVFGVYLLLLTISIGMYYEDWDQDDIADSMDAVNSKYQEILYNDDYVDQIEALQWVLWASEVILIIFLLLVYLSNNNRQHEGYMLPAFIFSPINTVIFLCIGIYILFSIYNNVFDEDGNLGYKDKYWDGFLGIGLTMMIVKVLLQLVSMILILGRYYELTGASGKRRKKVSRWDSDSSYSSYYDRRRGAPPMMYPAPAPAPAVPPYTIAYPVGPMYPTSLDRGLDRMGYGYKQKHTRPSRYPDRDGPQWLVSSLPRVHRPYHY